MVEDPPIYVIDSLFALFAVWQEGRINKTCFNLLGRVSFSLRQPRTNLPYFFFISLVIMSTNLE